MAYLDHNATSPLRPEARAAMERALGAANPSSVHAQGRKARALLEEARAHVAKLAHTDAQNVIFTSGGTEANALALHAAIYGSAEADARLTRIFISAIEHDSVRANASALSERFAGLRLETLPILANGTLDLESLRIALREGKGRALVAVMAANNETGVIQPIAEIAKIAREAGALLFVDAVQAAGKIPLDFDADYIAVSSHKLGGPQGAGALIVKPGVAFAPQILGGGQERGHRAGSENVAAIAGFGAAADVASHISNDLRDRFETALKEIAPEAIVFGKDAPRLANTSNFALPGVLAETAVMALDHDGVMISSGAACSSGKVKPSHVLAAMGVNEDIARCALRVSFGWNSAQADADAAVLSLSKLLARAKARAAA
jgi:cysteine desulfurase